MKAWKILQDDVKENKYSKSCKKDLLWFKLPYEIEGYPEQDICSEKYFQSSLVILVKLFIQKLKKDKAHAFFDQYCVSIGVYQSTSSVMK